jgi:hypothetical protein
MLKVKPTEVGKGTKKHQKDRGEKKRDALQPKWEMSWCAHIKGFKKNLN